MNSLFTGWLNTYLILLSAVTALGWMIGKWAFLRACFEPVCRPLKQNNISAQRFLRRGIDTDTLRDRRKLIQRPSPLP